MMEAKESGCSLCRYVLANVNKPGKGGYYCTNQDSEKFGQEAKGGCDLYHRFNARPDMPFKDALETIVMCPKGAYPHHFFKFGEEGETKRPFYCLSFETNAQMLDWQEALMRCFDELMRLKKEAGDFADGQETLSDTLADDSERSEECR